MTTKSIVTDTLETLLDLVTETIGEGEVAIFNGGRESPENTDEEWWVLGYWASGTYDGINPPDGSWEISVHGATLRGALCQAIAHPRFGQ